CMKLNLHSRISGNVISDGEFIVLIPFTKKDKKKALEPGVDETDIKSFD
ncbi:hypothetical protein Tco_1258428, partial [Tanacetum coccineum]